MPTLLLPLLVIAPMAVVAIVLGARTHQVRLERMRLEPDERTLLEDDHCHVRIHSPSRNTTQILVGTVVRLTTRRLIFAQKYLLGRSHLVQSVFLYRGEVPAIDRREGSFKSFVNYRIDAGSVTLDEKSAPPTLRLEARPEIDSPVVYGVELKLSCPRAGEIARALAPPAA